MIKGLRHKFISLIPKTKFELLKVIVAVLIIITIAGSIVKIASEKFVSNQESGTEEEYLAGIDTSSFERITSCLDKGEHEANRCFELFLRNYGENKEVSQLLQEMEAARLVNQDIENICHPIAHAIGREALRRYKTVGEAFRSCDFSCYSGCYHGVMERLFFTENEILMGQNHLQLDDLKERLPGVCDRSQFQHPTEALVFQCLHGSGHAALYSLGYKLKDALKACDIFETRYQRSSCYGGVFMENITAFDKSLRDLKEDDPHYPCNSVADTYAYDCYLLQTSRMLEMGYQLDQIAELCLQAGTDYSYTCFMSLGRDATGLIKNGQDYAQVAKLCEGVERSSYRQGCVAGVIYLLLDDPTGFEKAFKFCNNLSDAENQDQCFRDAIAYAGRVYEKTGEELGRQCTKYAGSGAYYCETAVSDYAEGYLSEKNI